MSYRAERVGCPESQSRKSVLLRVTEQKECAGMSHGSRKSVLVRMSHRAERVCCYGTESRKSVLV